MFKYRTRPYSAGIERKKETLFGRFFLFSNETSVEKARDIQSIFKNTNTRANNKWEEKKKMKKSERSSSIESIFLVSHQNGIGGEPDSMDREEQQHHKSFGYVCSMGRKVYSIQDTQSLEWMTSRVSSRSLSLVASLVGQLRQTLPSNSNIKGPAELYVGLWWHQEELYNIGGPAVRSVSTPFSYIFSMA